MLRLLFFHKRAMVQNGLAACISVKLAWIFILAFILQVASVYGMGGHSSVALVKLLIISSYVLLAIGVTFNLYSWSMRIIGVGLLLNLIVIFANGGLMPVSSESLEQAGLTEKAAGVQLGEMLTGSKGVLLSRDQTHLWFLSDIIPIPGPVPSIFSPGDLVIGAGFVLFLTETLNRFRTLQKAGTLSRSS